MKFKKHLLIIIGIPSGICLILAIALFFVASDIGKQTQKIKQLQEELNSRLQITESLALLHQDFEKAQPYLSSLENILPTRDQLVGFSRDLGIMARQNQIDLNSTLGQETPRSAGGLGKIDFTMTGQGSLDNFISFLKLIKNSRYFIEFKGLDFLRQNGDFKTLLTGEIFLF